MRDINNALTKVSRSCSYTHELSMIIKGKFTDYELSILERWLQIVEEEKRIEVNRTRNSVQFGRRF